MDKRDWAETVSGVVLGVLLGALLAWLLVSPGSDADDTGGARLANAAPSSRAPDPVGPDQAAPDDVQRCAAAATAIKAALRRADSSVDRWEVHVGAMNQLVVGAITLRQATAYWNRTRVGAGHEIDRFDRAWARLVRQAVDCPRPAFLSTRAPAELRSCARDVADDLRVLRAARTAIDTWRRHVRDMEMLRTGSMSASTANRMWLAMWHRGQRQIDRYRAAVRTARHGPSCTASSVTSPTS